MNKFAQFASLSWYDSTIEFVFRFVAKTSEPLLAAGLTVSAADYLSHGAVMAGHPAFSLAWAWAQAVALESSSGVVFVYSLQAFRMADKVKGVIYLILALLLAIVGGAMLLLQVNSTTMGSAEVAVPAINVMRVVVSIAYIFLLRAKHISFKNLEEQHTAPAAPVATPDVERIVDAIISRAMERVTVELESVTAPRLAAIAESKQEPLANAAPIYGPQFASKEAEIMAFLEAQPGASIEQVAQACNCTPRTALKWMEKYSPKEE